MVIFFSLLFSPIIRFLKNKTKKLISGSTPFRIKKLIINSLGLNCFIIFEAITIMPCSDEIPILHNILSVLFRDVY